MDDKFVPFHEFFDVFKPINLEPNKRLQVLIILSAVHDLMISDPNKWRLPSAALDYGCSIEDDVEIGLFPNHTEKGLKGGKMISTTYITLSLGIPRMIVTYIGS